MLKVHCTYKIKLHWTNRNVNLARCPITNPSLAHSPTLWKYYAWSSPPIKLIIVVLIVTTTTTILVIAVVIDIDFYTICVTFSHCQNTCLSTSWITKTTKDPIQL